MFEFLRNLEPKLIPIVVVDGIFVTCFVLNILGFFVFAIRFMLKKKSVTSKVL
jgi:hypothetical protein